MFKYVFDKIWNRWYGY